MNKIREYLNKPLYVAAAAFVLGLLVGLPLLGWLIWPVQWTDAEPRDLRSDLKEQYLCMVVDSFKVNKDSNLAAQRLSVLGYTAADAPALLDTLDPKVCGMKTVSSIVLLKAALLNTPLPAETEAATAPTEIAAETEVAAVPTMAAEVTAETKTKSTPWLLLGGLMAILLVIGGAIAYRIFSRRPAETAAPIAAPSAPLDEEQGASIAHYSTTYVIGDDLYDDSFSIDSPSGEFLGDCGVGISDTIGVGDPKKVTAFEVWLFDKTDTQTSTKVVMSEHAFNDPATRQKLALKGEPVLLEPGAHIYLEASNLQMDVHVLDLKYGQGALPEKSYIERMNLDLTIWAKS
jgi:hypothetical protein